MEVRKGVLRVPQALVFSHSWRNDMTKSSGKMRAIGNESGDKNIRNQEDQEESKESKTKKANKSLLCSGARTSKKLFNLPNYPETLRLM